VEHGVSSRAGAEPEPIGNPAAEVRRQGSRVILGRIFAFARPYRLQIVLSAAALVTVAATMLALGVGLRWLVDRGFADRDATYLDRGLMAMFVTIAIMAVATYGRAYFVGWIGERVTSDFRRAVYANALRQGPAFFEAARTGELLSRLTADTTVVQMVISSTASMALRNVLMLTGGTVMMAITSPRLTLLVAVVVPFVVAPVVVFGRRIRRLAREAQERLGAVGAEASEAFASVHTVQAYNQEGRSLARYGALVDRALETAVERTRMRATLGAIMIVLTFGAVGTVLWIGGHDMLAGRITPGELSAFVFYAILVASAVGALSQFSTDLQRAVGAAERLFELMDAQPEIVPPAAPLPLPEPAQGTVRFEEVSFRYPTRPDRAALDEVSFRVNPGETVALVGPSGAGKTTVFQLILRFYDPQAGRVLIDGVDARQADPAAVRARVALVPQEPAIFATTVAENIRYGRPEATDAEVRAAAEAAAAQEFIDRLPQGYATDLGERGIRLSGGQRQRIAIARAILRDPALLLLDEATSALDAESERLVQQALDRLMRDRTVLVIAHRLATVLRSDRILVIDQGRIVAAGTHAELVAGGGLYARLAALQFSDAAEGTPPLARAAS